MSTVYFCKAISSFCQEQGHVHSYPMAILFGQLCSESSGTFFCTSRWAWPGLREGEAAIASWKSRINNQDKKLLRERNVIEKSRPMIDCIDIGSTLFWNASFSQQVLPCLVWANPEQFAQIHILIFLRQRETWWCEWEYKQDNDDVLRGSNKMHCSGDKFTNVTECIKSRN